MRKRITTVVIIVTTLLIYPLSQVPGSSHDTCDTPPNRAPMAKGTIDPVTLGVNPDTIDVSDKFKDDDGDTLTYKVLVSADAIVKAHMDSSKVIIGRDSVFRATITVVATDPDSLKATQTIAVKVNQAPLAVDSIASVMLGVDPDTVDVSDKFSDADGDTLTYKATVSDTAIATVSMDDGKVTIKPGTKEGNTMVTVTAEDRWGLQAKQYIAVVQVDPIIKVIEHIIIVFVVTGIGALLLKFAFKFNFNFDTRIGEKGKVQENKDALRRLQYIVGVLGIGLPLLLLIACLYDYGSNTMMVEDFSKCVKNSISAYYDSASRDVFVGILCVIGAFLFAYKGYDTRDDQASHLAGLSAFGVALFPATSNNRAVEAMHYLSAILLFLTLAYISRYRFTKSKCESIRPGTLKAKRNQVYNWCAYMMIFGLLAIGAFKCLKLPAMNDYKMMSAAVLLLVLTYFLINAYFSWHSTEKAKQNKKSAHVITFGLFAIGVGVWTQYYLTSFPFMFVTETVLFLAFGISWLVKSDTLILLRDKDENDVDDDQNGADDDENDSA